MNSRFSDDNSERRFRKPPNYFSRRVQLRLLMLVSLLMLVIVAMDEARDPKYYAWMWADQQQPVPDDTDVDTRLPPQPQVVEPIAPDAIRTQHRPPPLDAETVQAASNAADEPLEQAKIDGWAAVIDALNVSEQSQLRDALLASRQGRRLDAQQRRRFSPALNKVIEQWKQYLADAAKLLEKNAELTSEERAAWGDLLTNLEARWARRTQPAFEVLFQDRDLTDAERQSLEEVQAMLDRLALAAVRDNSVMRSKEQGAWFRLLEFVQQDSPEKMAEQAEFVGFLQLYKQPKEYRGKLVTIRGTARLGYRIRAPRNSLGIEEYNILWVKPRGGPNSPFVVYALETPEGFPQLKSKDEGNETTTLDADVTVTGYFFKNWAYRSKGGINVAPLVIARFPRTMATPTVVDDGPLPVSKILLVCGVMALLAVVIAAAVYLVHSWPNRASAYFTREPLAEPNKDDVREDVMSALKDLEQSPPA